MNSHPFRSPAVGDIGGPPVVGPAWRLLVVICLACLAVAGRAQGWELRVCAEPNNLPYSNEWEEGFENRVAELLAEELGASLSYVWIPQPRRAIRDALVAVGECDVLLGIADGHEHYLTSIAYYRTSYVFVQLRDSRFQVRSFDDSVLRELRIGVQAPGGEGVGPGTHALANRGLIANQVTFVADLDAPHPQARVVEAVAAGEVDVAIVWGPVAGYFAQRQAVPLELVPVSPEVDLPFVPMVFSISLGVRIGDTALADQLNRALAARWDDVQVVLRDYGVPLLALPRPSATREGR